MPATRARQINAYLPADVKSADCDHPLARASGPLREAAGGGEGGVQGADLLHAGDGGGGAGRAERLGEDPGRKTSTTSTSGAAGAGASSRCGRCTAPQRYSGRDCGCSSKVPYGQKTDLGNGVSFTFFDAGHILGSAYVLLEWTEAGRPAQLLFTADVGRYDAPILRDPLPLAGAGGLRHHREHLRHDLAWADRATSSRSCWTR